MFILLFLIASVQCQFPIRRIDSIEFCVYALNILAGKELFWNNFDEHFQLFSAEVASQNIPVSTDNSNVCSVPGFQQRFRWRLWRDFWWIWSTVQYHGQFKLIWRKKQTGTNGPQRSWPFYSIDPLLIANEFHERIEWIVIEISWSRNRIQRLKIKQISIPANNPACYECGKGNWRRETKKNAAEQIGASRNEKTANGRIINWNLFSSPKHSKRFEGTSEISSLLFNQNLKSDHHFACCTNERLINKIHLPLLVYHIGESRLTIKTWISG